jgi:Asp-tRNA(Asn)/Glu-tRNA(Gln) amidotransferase A subunit family amidase
LTASGSTVKEVSVMYLHTMPLASTADAVRNDQLDLAAYVSDICEHIDCLEPAVHALLPEANRKERLLAEAEELRARFPMPEQRPPLYGIPVGVKDIIHVDGFPTKAGSRVPAEVLAGEQAQCITKLREAGALILGKTVTTEFAYFAAGETRNPHNYDHTPGGSSSGSAAGIAAGYCPLTIGTQTGGSVIRPAAFCGVVGFKPSYGRIPFHGVIASTTTFDTLGVFTQDVAGAALAASIMCDGWQTVPAPRAAERLPVLGVPDGPYLQRAQPEALKAYEAQLEVLQRAGYTIRHVPALDDIEALERRQQRIVYAEMALAYGDWYAQYPECFHSTTVESIKAGKQISADELTALRTAQAQVRGELESLMRQNGIDLWVTPSAPGPAPEGLASTGSPIMNLPWMHAGFPAISLPAGRTAKGLPLGCQFVSPFWQDEDLLTWASALAHVLAACW